MTRSHPLFDGALADLSDRHREEVLNAFAALEHGAEPVPEVMLLALRDAMLRERLNQVLRAVGRTLVALPGPKWTSGYRDDIATHLAATGWSSLQPAERAVMTVILIHSVAIPRSHGKISADVWVSPIPTSRDEIFGRRIPPGEAETALSSLRARGLVGYTRAQGGGYVPGPQWWRLTPQARQRVQEELILAAAPDSPLAAAIRRRREQHDGAA